jgi:hypothetical protein
MKQSYKRRPHDFRRRILRRDIKKQFLKEEESRWLNLIKSEELGKRYYNLSKIMNGNGWEKDKLRTEEEKKKISEGAKKAWKEGRITKNTSHFEKGKIPWNKGKTGIYSEETKKKISEARQNQIFSDESIEKRAAKLRGKKRKKEDMDKMVQTKKERRAAGLYKTVVPWNKGLKQK